MDQSADNWPELPTSAIKEDRGPPTPSSSNAVIMNNVNNNNNNANTNTTNGHQSNNPQTSSNGNATNGNSGPPGQGGPNETPLQPMVTGELNDTSPQTQQSSQNHATPPHMASQVNYMDDNDPHLHPQDQVINEPLPNVGAIRPLSPIQSQMVAPPSDKELMYTQLEPPPPPTSASLSSLTVSHYSTSPGPINDNGATLITLNNNCGGLRETYATQKSLLQYEMTAQPPLPNSMTTHMSTSGPIYSNSLPIMSVQYQSSPTGVVTSSQLSHSPNVTSNMWEYPAAPQPISIPTGIGTNLTYTQAPPMLGGAPTAEAMEIGRVGGIATYQQGYAPRTADIPWDLYGNTVSVQPYPPNDSIPRHLTSGKYRLFQWFFLVKAAFNAFQALKTARIRPLLPLPSSILIPAE